MKKIGNISRSIITVLFICCIVIFIVYAFIYGKSSIFNGSSGIIYFLVILLSITGLVYIGNLHNSQNHLKKMTRLRTLYKYVYIAIITVFTRVYMAYMHFKSINIVSINPSKNNGVLSFVVNALEKLFESMTEPSLCVYCLLNIIVTFLTAVVIKKILYRLCENETMSYISSILYIFIPANLYSVGQYNMYLFNMLYIMIGIYYIIKIYYEIVQYKVKNNKYIFYTVILTLIIILDIFFGGNIWFWVSLMLMFMVTSIDVDTIDIRYKKTSSPKKDYINREAQKRDLGAAATKKKMNNAFVSKGVVHIPKTVLVFVILLIFGVAVQILYNVSDYGSSLSDIYTIAAVLQEFTKYTKTYYVGFGIVIIICQILCLILKRKLDYKTFLLMLSLVFYVIFSSGTQYICGRDIIFATLYEVLLVIFIGNVYYSRDEKIKLLTK